jgi:hypothetical protein
MIARRKLRLWAILAVSGLFVSVAGAGLLLRHEPEFYRRALIEAGDVRKQLSRNCMTRFVQLQEDFRSSTKPWGETLTEAQINAFFQDDFALSEDAESLRRQGLSDIRVSLEDETLKVGFRYGSDPWSAVISYDLRIWLVPREFNVFAVELLGRHAGALPIISETLLTEMSELGRKKGIELTWYRHEGNPVALVRLQPDRPRPTAQLQRLDLRKGEITIAGVWINPSETAAVRGKGISSEPRGN